MLRRAARRTFNAWNRGDFALVPNIDDPEVQTRITGASGRVIGMDAVYYGPEGHCRAMETWNEAWGEWDADIDEIVELGRDQIVVIARIHAEGAGSGIEFDEWGVVRYTFREGRISRVDAAVDPDRARALELLVSAE